MLLLILSVAVGNANIFRRRRYGDPVQKVMITDNESDELGLDEALVTFRNFNYTYPVMFYGQTTECEKCNLLLLSEVPVNMHNNVSVKLDTKYGYNIQINFTNGTVSYPVRCNITKYEFYEHGHYIFDVYQRTVQGSNECSIIKKKNPDHVWLPFVVGIVFVIVCIFLTQLLHRFYHSRYMDRLLSNVAYQRLINNDLGTPKQQRVSTSNLEIVNGSPTNEGATNTRDSDIFENTGTGQNRLSNNTMQFKKVLPKRLRGLDVFRGFSLMIMIFVNYGGEKQLWNGLTIADLVFPWFTWVMGVSIVLSQRSMRSKNVRKTRIFTKIVRRTIILFLLGLALQGRQGNGTLKELRIFGVLQRLALCYFFTAVLELLFDTYDIDARSPLSNSVDQPLSTELRAMLMYWPQWLFVLLITIAWLLITFLVDVPGCGRGYLGPGGRHRHGKFENCTGGASGYIDRYLLHPSHMYNDPTCKGVYDTKLAYDPEGILGTLTGILLCYLGVQAGHSFLHSTRVIRVCCHWIVSGIICGTIGLILSLGGQSDSWIPINKNLWSLSFVLVLASLAFVILTIFYLIVDVKTWFTGSPFLWLGMNSIVLYVGHDMFGRSFPVQFEVGESHAKKLAIH
ncbi:unnamed protein product, partial [Didymodactylos carnosus]